MKNNRYSRALRVLKSTEVDDKIKSLNEMPTNHTKGLYSLNDPGFRVGQKDPQKVYYPDVDGNWPAGIPGTPGELEYVRPEGYWSGGSDWDTQVATDFSQDYLLNDPTGRSTSGLISDNGTVFSELPPNSEGFILGPVVDGFVPNHTSDAYTNIGYIQKDTRQFVLLARVQGQWKSNLNGNYPVWGGTSTGFTSYNQNFTLEMAQWVRDKILNDKYTSKVPYFYSGGVPQVPQSPADCPNCPPGMYGGNGIGPRQFGSGGNPSVGTQQGPPKSGDAKDAGFPWELFGKIGDKIKDLLGGAAKTVSGVLYNIQQAPINVLEYVFSNTPQEMIADAIQVTGQIIGLESAANMLNAYQSFLGNPNSAGSSPSNPYNATNDISTADMKLLSNNIYRDSSITELLNGLQKGSYSSEKVTLRGFGRFSEVEVKTSILESKVSNAVSNAVSESRGLDNSLHNNVQANIQKSVEKGEIVLTKEYVFRPGGSVEASEKTIVGQVLSALGVELDTAGGSGLVYLGFAAAALGLSNSKQYGGLYKSPGMHYEITVPKPSNIKESKEVLSENRQRILRDIKKPYVLPEVPKQKYKMNFAGKHSAQNTPDKTASKLSDELVATGNARGQKWRLQDKYWQGYETTERMNVIYDRVGHGDQYFERIIGENQRKVSWKNKEIQEHLNIIAHEKAMKEENPNYESPFYKTIQEQETIEADKDPLLKKVYKKLKKEIDYPDKPSKNGDPNDPPPEMVNGYHPNFGKKVNYYKKLDPDSANSMPETGDPEIDSQVRAARKKPK